MRAIVIEKFGGVAYPLRPSPNQATLRNQNRAPADSSKLLQKTLASLLIEVQQHPRRSDAGGLPAAGGHARNPSAIAGLRNWGPLCSWRCLRDAVLNCRQRDEGALRDSGAVEHLVRQRPNADRVQQVRTSGVGEDVDAVGWRGPRQLETGKMPWTRNATTRTVLGTPAIHGTSIAVRRIFGAVSLFRVRRVVLLEVSVIAILGIVIILLAATGAGGVTSTLLLWTAGPLVAGVPAAALHGRRLRRRVDT
ncbi:hypothetical protein [Saccharopolyspora shandongensis]|uniref:hypothetical protein n=1 Tax=Saccharopolyspora shandongensis TaxID=418495 RepID=UPI0033E4FE2B